MIGTRLPVTLALAVALMGVGGVAQAQDDAPAIEFDRPGLAFATATLPAGAFAWEQGLPDASTDRSGGVRTTEFLADTTLRFGLVDALELQIEHDTYAYVAMGGGGVREGTGGSGNTSAGLLWALPGRSDAFEWAMLGTATVARGRAPIGDDDRERALGVSASWTLPADASVTAYVNRSWSRDGRGWLLATDYLKQFGDDLQAYVEAGVGTGEARQRVAGAGVLWMVTPRLQLDASVLRGLDRDSPDWQAGVGFSLYFAPRNAAR